MKVVALCLLWTTAGRRRRRLFIPFLHRWGAGFFNVGKGSKIVLWEYIRTLCHTRVSNRRPLAWNKTALSVTCREKLILSMISSVFGLTSRRMSQTNTFTSETKVLLRVDVLTDRFCRYHRRLSPSSGFSWSDCVNAVGDTCCWFVSLNLPAVPGICTSFIYCWEAAGFLVRVKHKKAVFKPERKDPPTKLWCVFKHFFLIHTLI